MIFEDYWAIVIDVVDVVLPRDVILVSIGHLKILVGFFNGRMTSSFQVARIVLGLPMTSSFGFLRDPQRRADVLFLILKEA